MGNIARYIADSIDHGRYLSPPGNLREFLNVTNNCQGCHRDADADAFPKMADCLVCHSKIDPPESCAQCHLPQQQLRPSNHTEHFLSDHTSGKMNLNKATCAVCHGRTFTCLGCH